MSPPARGEDPNWYLSQRASSPTGSQWRQGPCTEPQTSVPPRHSGQCRRPVPERGRGRPPSNFEFRFLAAVLRDRVGQRGDHVGGSSGWVRRSVEEELFPDLVLLDG